MTEQSAAGETHNAPQVGQPAPDVTLHDEDGREVTLSAYWRERPTFFVWIRHFG
jgi:peroxiredoxin